MEKILKTSSGIEIKVIPKEVNQGSPVSISSDGKLVQYRTDATQIEVLHGVREVWISVFGEREAANLLNQFIIEGGMNNLFPFISSQFLIYVGLVGADTMAV